MNKVKAVVFGVMMSAAITANAANETTTVTGEVGKDVKLSLESNPTTGYGWMIKDLPDGLIFVSEDMRSQKTVRKVLSGAVVKRYFTSLVRRKGKVL